MYQMLQTDQWQIADTCPKLIEAIPSRMHDEKRPGNVLKVPGDPLHDVADDVRYGIFTFMCRPEQCDSGQGQTGMPSIGSCGNIVM